MPETSVTHAPDLPLAVVGLVAFLGLYFGFAARRIRLPALIGYMLLGILAGPSVAGALSEGAMDRLSFITEVALGFVAFTIGAELRVSELRRLGRGIVAIILAESFVTFACVTAALYLWTGDLALSLIFGAVSPASAPAGTVAVIQECKARGSLTKALYAVVGFDDGLAIIIFGFAAAVARSLLIQDATGEMGSILPYLVRPVVEIALSLVVGGVIGVVFSHLVRRLTSNGEMFALSSAAILIGTGVSVQGFTVPWLDMPVELSLILTNMVVGFLLANTRREALVHRVSDSVMHIMPLVFVLFFALAGAHLQLSLLPALGMVGLLYVLARTAGKIAGSHVGARIFPVEPKIRRYIGLGILSQAGVTIGLALIVKQQLDQVGAQFAYGQAVEMGTIILTTVTATSVVFEIIGPIATRHVLYKAGEAQAK
jgi:Kef-type K+ transport system membrane component KefB